MLRVYIKGQSHPPKQQTTSKQTTNNEVNKKITFRGRNINKLPIWKLYVCILNTQLYECQKTKWTLKMFKSFQKFRVINLCISIIHFNTNYACNQSRTAGECPLVPRKRGIWSMWLMWILGLAFFLIGSLSQKSVMYEDTTTLIWKFEELFSSHNSLRKEKGCRSPHPPPPPPPPPRLFSGLSSRHTVFASNFKHPLWKKSWVRPCLQHNNRSGSSYPWWISWESMTAITPTSKLSPALGMSERKTCPWV